MNHHFYTIVTSSTSHLNISWMLKSIANTVSAASDTGSNHATHDPDTSLCLWYFFKYFASYSCIFLSILLLTPHDHSSFIFHLSSLSMIWPTSFQLFYIICITPSILSDVLWIKYRFLFTLNLVSFHWEFISDSLLIIIPIVHTMLHACILFPQYYGSLLPSLNYFAILNHRTFS